MKLYSYWRSSAAYRVRIALQLKGQEADYEPVHLVKDGGQQYKESYLEVNPAASVPTLVTDSGVAITQSLAILAYLEDVFPSPPLLPGSPENKARIRSAALLIACDVHPLNIPRVTNQLKSRFGANNDAVQKWMKHWMYGGLAAFEKLIDPDSRFCFQDEPTMADLCLIPQLYNARRWGLELEPFKRLTDIEHHCLYLPEFRAASPEMQEDAEV